MKTININLKGELGRVPKASRAKIQQDELDTKTKLIFIISLAGIIVILASSFGVWMLTKKVNKTSKIELAKLHTEHENLQKEEKKLILYNKNLKEQKKLAEYKFLAKEQINDLFIPWSAVLKDLASKVPKDVIILNIAKTSRRGASTKLNISGIIPAGKTYSKYASSGSKPLTAISFLILNINEDKNSLLNNAKIQNIKYKNKTDVYEFDIEANVVTLNERNERL